MGVAAIILAAGESRRLRRAKQLLPYRGRPLLRVIATEARASSCERVIVVLGADESAVRPSLDGLDVEIVSNAGWPEGIACPRAVRSRSLPGDSHGRDFANGASVIIAVAASACHGRSYAAGRGRLYLACSGTDRVAIVTPDATGTTRH